MFFNFLIFYFAFCRNFVSLKNAAPVQSNSLQASWHSVKCLEHIDEATTRPPSMLLQRLWRLWPQPHCLLRAIANKVASCCHSVLPHEDVVLGEFFTVINLDDFFSVFFFFFFGYDHTGLLDCHAP